MWTIKESMINMSWNCSCDSDLLLNVGCFSILLLHDGHVCEEALWLAKEFVQVLNWRWQVFDKAFMVFRRKDEHTENPSV